MPDRSTPHRWWLLLRRPLLLALFLGSGVSLMSSGRLTPRLVVDGAVSLAFVPVFEFAAFALVYRRRSGGAPLALEFDRFFTTNTPWLLCTVVLAAIASLQAPRDVGRWTVLPLVVFPLGAIAVALAWSAALDVGYFRRALKRSTADAVRDAILFRAIAWTAGTVYFVGLAIWPYVASRGSR